MPRHRHSHRKHHDNENYDEWDKHDRSHRRHRRFASRFAVVLPVIITLAVCGGVGWFVFKPTLGNSGAASNGNGNGTPQAQDAFTDRAAAFKVLELMEANRVSEAITWAEGISSGFFNPDQDIAAHISKHGGETRARLEGFICNWILMEHAGATQSTFARQRGWPNPSTTDAMVNFLCNYADYRARGFTPPPREINEEAISRILLVAAMEKHRRAGGARALNP